MAIQPSGLLGVNFTNRDATAQFALGTKVTGPDGQVFTYVQANGAILVSNFLGIDEDFQAAKLTKAMADDGWTIGVATAAFADDEYGFVATQGTNLTGTVLSLCAADVALYTSATAGCLDDTSASQTKLDGVVLVAANATGTGAKEVILTFPRSATF